jgi:2-hydroxychromene-2-carboxylate isomerase
MLPARAEWRPIAFGVIVRRIGKRPWSFNEDRHGDFDKIARRAADRGLPARELFRPAFVDGRHVADADAVLDAVERAGMDRHRVREAIESTEVKERLRAQTDAALQRGVTGVPTVAISDRLFWGDDRLAEAGAALARVGGGGF